VIYSYIVVAVVGIGAIFIIANLGIELWFLFRKRGLTFSDMETSMAEGNLRYDIQDSLRHQFTTNGAWMIFCDQCLAESRDRHVGVWIVYREKHVQLQVKQWWTAWCLMWGMIGRMRTVSPGVYKHYKGRLYTVSSEALHTETTEPHVVYQHWDGTGPDGPTWIRPTSMFLETVEVEGCQRPRFTPLDTDPSAPASHCEK